MVKIIKFGVCVLNDSTHTFDEVTDILKEIFSWDVTQAANCAHIIDNQGKYVVKWFDKNQTALYVVDFLQQRGLTVTIITDKTQTIEE